MKYNKFFITISMLTLPVSLPVSFKGFKNSGCALAVATAKIQEKTARVLYFFPVTKLTNRCCVLWYKIHLSLTKFKLYGKLFGTLNL